MNFSDKVMAYDDISDSLIGLRNSAWARRHDDNFKAKLFYHLTNALLTNDIELVRIMQISDIVDVTYTE